MSDTHIPIKFNNKTITPSENFDRSIFENITWSYDSLLTHHDVAKNLINKHPYTITVIIDNLDWYLRNKKEYVIKTRTPIISKYRELLHKYFFDEFGYAKGNDLFGQWLKKYEKVWKKEDKFETIDDYILAIELEPRYRTDILRRFKNHEKLFKNRVRINRKRRFNIPEPLNHYDYRNPFDTFFIWNDSGRKVARKGGSGSSGQRETNSKYVYGLLELSRIQPVPSYLFIYSDHNQLLFVKKFDTLCVPAMDIGSNYFLEKAEHEKLIRNGTFIRWDDYNKVTSIETNR